METKRATPREARDNPDAGQSVKKIFIGGVSEDIEDEELQTYFEQVHNFTFTLNKNRIHHCVLWKNIPVLRFTKHYLLRQSLSHKVCVSYHTVTAFRRVFQILCILLDIHVHVQRQISEHSYYTYINYIHSHKWVAKATWSTQMK